MDFSTYLSPEIEATVNYLVEKTGRPKAYYRRKLAEIRIRRLDDLEDFEEYHITDVLDPAGSGEEVTYLEDHLYSLSSLLESLPPAKRSARDGGA